MAKKEKPKNKSKPQTGQKKKPTALEKAEANYKKAKSNLDKAKESYRTASKNTAEKEKQWKKTKKEKDKKSYLDWNKVKRSRKKAVDRAQKAFDTANTKLSRFKEKQQEKYDNELASAISKHKKSFTGEGNMAIYPTSNSDGGSSNIVFFAPVNSETESNSSNVTSYAVDKGAPRKDYVRFSSKTVTIDGLIADTDTGTAHDKWVRLRTWHSYHRELTFKGDIYYKHLVISQLDRQFTGNQNTMQVTITFTFVRAAEITTSTKKKKNAKTSKSSKTLAGDRNKNYTAITIKKGDTLWGLSKRYGKSVAWLQKVNHIKNPNRIFAGNPIYVNDKEHKAKSKVRVK